MKSKKNKTNIDASNLRDSSLQSQKPNIKRDWTKQNLTKYTLNSNNLNILYSPRIGTGVITTDIVYKVGSRDEARGETGLAHMLEHMLFKPTVADKKRKTDSGAMLFEREKGIILNANTWKDRTSYFFSYPKKYFHRALQIESERMRGVVLSDSEFLQERSNVVSEFDMYAGDETFLLSTEMTNVAFVSHPYGHETIGFREDILDYTVPKLRLFYEKYYIPSNATLIIVGDISEKEMRKGVIEYFARLKAPMRSVDRLYIKEPKQYGQRIVTIEKPSSKKLYGIGIKHDGFPTKEWFEAMVIINMLTDGEDSILHKNLIDTGLASKIDATIEPTYDQNLAVLLITISEKSTHEEIHKNIKKSISELTVKIIQQYLKKSIAKAIMSEYISHESSLGYVSDLVEYVSADAPDRFFESEKILRSITPNQIHKKVQKLFSPRNTVIGHFIGTT